MTPSSPPQRNVLITGGIFHPFHATSSHLAQSFASLGIETAIFDDVEAGLAHVRTTRPALLTLNLLRWRMVGEKYDPYRDRWRFELSEEGRKTIAEHVDGGGGLLGLHTASICFDSWAGWGDVLGADWVWGESYHPPLGRVEVTPTTTPHPITSGLGRFIVNDEVYTKLAVRDDVRGLLEALPGDGAPAQPLLWARACGRGRVVYDALGHDVGSLAEPTHARILARAALWLLARDDELGDH
jgi:type 1 glutamine amidotransferase